jgi:hypothetical protein
MKKKFPVPVLIGIIFIAAVLFVHLNNNGDAEPAEIIALPQMTDIYTDYTGSVTREEYFIIRNSPKNLEALKVIVEKYNADNPVAPMGNGEERVGRTFIRESDYSNKRWWSELGIARYSLNAKQSAFLSDHVETDSVAKIYWGTEALSRSFEVKMYAYRERKENGDVTKMIFWTIGGTANRDDPLMEKIFWGFILIVLILFAVIKIYWQKRMERARYAGR